jgi:hypothetical protein
VLATCLALAACGVVGEDGAWLSERSARETMRAAREMEERGDLPRAAEVYEGLALGFPEQHWAPRALEGAARARTALAARALGPRAAEEARRAARLWLRLADRHPDAPGAAAARLKGGVLLARTGSCREARPLLEAALAAGLEPEDEAAVRRALDLCR